MKNTGSSASFVSFEGIDGCGKSTLLAQLSTWLEGLGARHIKTREPGGTRLGEALRDILLDSSFSAMHSWTEILLYAAGRAQHVKEVVRPALDQGLWVLSDRYVDATLAYQGYGRGLDLDRLRKIHEWSSEGLWPDVTVLLDCDVATAFERRQHREDEPDRLERQSEAFHERVRAGYLALARGAPHRFIVLDAGRPLMEVTRDFRLIFEQRLNTG